MDRLTDYRSLARPDRLPRRSGIECGLCRPLRIDQRLGSFDDRAARSLAAAERLTDGIGAFDEEQQAVRELLRPGDAKRRGDVEQASAHLTLVGFHHVMPRMRGV